MSRPRTRFLKITPREWDVIRMLTEGMPPAEIGEILQITVSTVSRHISNIELKCRVDNRLRLQNILINIRQESEKYQYNADVMTFAI